MSLSTSSSQRSQAWHLGTTDSCHRVFVPVIHLFTIVAVTYGPTKILEQKSPQCSSCASHDLPYLTSAKRANQSYHLKATVNATELSKKTKKRCQG